MIYFANPLCLIALSGVLIPVIIHLVRFHRYRRVYFSNTEMLLELQTEQQSRSRLREWIVLAVRILVITFIVFAFAQPKIRHNNEARQVGGTCVSVYIDNSFSMGSEGKEGILLEQAKTKAREIAAAYPPDTKYQIVTNDNAGQRRQAMTRDEFITTIDNIQISTKNIAIAEAMTKQRDFGTIAVCANTYAYIVSDFQRTLCDWEQIEQAASTDTNNQQQIHFSFIPLTAAGQGNIFIDSIWLDAPLANVGSKVKLSVRVRNTGNKRVEDLPLRLYLNGEQKALAALAVEKNSQTTTDISFTVREMGVLNGHVEITDYPISFDDKLYFSVNVKPRLQVMALHGTSPNVFIRNLFDGDTLTSYSESSIATADFSQIDEMELITVTSVDKIQSGIAQTLASFVSDGGSLLIVPPSDCDKASYNVLLAALNAPLLDNYEETDATCTWLNSEAQLYDQVFRSVDNNVELPTVKGFFSLKNTPEAASEQIIKFANGAPYFVAVPSGKGTVYIFTAPLDTKYCDFVQQALFVPTVYNMALYSRPLPQLYYTLGREGVIELPNGWQTSPTLSFTKDGESGATVVNIKYNNRRPYLMSDDLEADAGNYRLTDGNSEHGISFNYSREESLMEFLGTKELNDTIKSLQNDNVELLDNNTISLDELIKQRSGGTSLAKICIIAALFFLLCETLLLRIPFRIKRHSSQTVH